MTDAFVDTLHAGTGARLQAGARLLDVTIDLSDSSPQDCPPISHYRLVLREAAWLRRWLVGPSDRPAVGAGLAIFSSAADETLEGVAARPVRVMTASIVRESQALLRAGHG